MQETVDAVHRNVYKMQSMRGACLELVVRLNELGDTLVSYA